ncbi:hydroxyacylglutathione hydrolase [Rhizosaccharibacter radicis]|uniref:Hydroxyacylglutathione hydrolase n=1 Tax=Rhizosaccharibacter radicis TaxID=2782605 RepID=A0ABT1VXB1_9PROT|nr:hydroxyacylglutathione hydrolase [Acetobacteraceae bacterium KSS12]
MTSALRIEPIPILSDNYAWLLRDTRDGAVAVVDPADADAVGAVVDRRGGRLDWVLLTHHHDDHIAGAEAIARRFGARIAGAAADRHRLPPLDLALSSGDRVVLGTGADAAEGEVIATPGHTAQHISFFFADGPALFCGDTLFSLGCGRLLEGTADEMFASFRRFDRLPDDTLVCCGHEYTESNLRFALSVDENNPALRARGAAVARQRAAGEPTVPTRLAEERAANPFLRAPDAGELARLRRAKDSFR